MYSLQASRCLNNLLSTSSTNKKTIYMSGIMPKRTTLTDRFRRVSTNEIFRRSSKAEAQPEPLPEYDEERPTPIRSKTVPEPLPSQSTESSLLALPTEIHAEILSYTDYASLCAFRLASRTTHHLLSAGDIVRAWIAFHIDDHRLFLHPPPSPPTFAYVVEQRRREVTVTRTAFVLVEYIEHEILRHTLRRARIEVDMYRQGLFGLVSQCHVDGCCFSETFVSGKMRVSALDPRKWSCCG